MPENQFEFPHPRTRNVQDCRSVNEFVEAKAKRSKISRALVKFLTGELDVNAQKRLQIALNEGSENSGKLNSLLDYFKQLGYRCLEDFEEHQERVRQSYPPVDLRRFSREKKY